MTFEQPNYSLPTHTPGGKRNRLAQIVGVTILIAGWYLASSFSNNLNKQILMVYPHPIILTIAQLGFIALYSFLFLWKTNKLQLLPLHDIIHLVLPLGFINFLSHLLTYSSLANVPVSFMHTIKVSLPSASCRFSMRTSQSPSYYFSN